MNQNLAIEKRISFGNGDYAIYLTHTGEVVDTIRKGERWSAGNLRSFTKLLAAELVSAQEDFATASSGVGVDNHQPPAAQQDWDGFEYLIQRKEGGHMTVKCDRLGNLRIRPTDDDMWADLTGNIFILALTKEIFDTRSRVAAIRNEGPLMRVDVDNGKYTVIQDRDGRLHALRYGKEWQDLVGNNLVLSLAAELEQARERIAELEGEISSPDGGMKP